MDNKHILLSSFFPLALPLHYTVQQAETQLMSTNGCSLSATSEIQSYITGDFAIYTIPANSQSSFTPEQQIQTLLRKNNHLKGSLVVHSPSSANTLWFGFSAVQPGSLNYALLKHTGQKMSDGETEIYQKGVLIRQLTCNSLCAGNYYLQLEYSHPKGVQRLSVPFVIA